MRDSRRPIPAKCALGRRRRIDGFEACCPRGTRFRSRRSQEGIEDGSAGQAERTVCFATAGAGSAPAFGSPSAAAAQVRSRTRPRRSPRARAVHAALRR